MDCNVFFRPIAGTGRTALAVVQKLRLAVQVSKSPVTDESTREISRCFADLSL